MTQSRQQAPRPHRCVLAHAVLASVCKQGQAGK
jgi:hypothetical protein